MSTTPCPETEKTVKIHTGEKPEDVHDVDSLMPSLTDTNLFCGANSLPQLSGSTPSQTTGPTWAGNQTVSYVENHGTDHGHHPRFQPERGHHAPCHYGNPHCQQQYASPEHAQMYPVGPPHTYPYNNYGRPSIHGYHGMRSPNSHLYESTRCRQELCPQTPRTDPYGRQPAHFQAHTNHISQPKEQVAKRPRLTEEGRKGSSEGQSRPSDLYQHPGNNTAASEEGVYDMEDAAPTSSLQYSNRYCPEVPTHPSTLAPSPHYATPAAIENTMAEGGATGHITRPSNLQEAVCMYIDYLIEENHVIVPTTSEPYVHGAVTWETDAYAQEVLHAPTSFPTKKFRAFMRQFNIEVEVHRVDSGDASEEVVGSDDASLSSDDSSESMRQQYTASQQICESNRQITARSGQKQICQNTSQDISQPDQNGKAMQQIRKKNSQDMPPDENMTVQQICQNTSLDNTENIEVRRGRPPGSGTEAATITDVNSNDGDLLNINNNNNYIDRCETINVPCYPTISTNETRSHILPPMVSFLEPQRYDPQVSCVPAKAGDYHVHHEVRYDTVQQAMMDCDMIDSANHSLGLPAHQGAVLTNRQGTVYPALHEPIMPADLGPMFSIHQGSVIDSHPVSGLSDHQGLAQKESILPAHQGSVATIQEQSVVPGHQGSVVAAQEESFGSAHQRSVVVPQEESESVHQGSVVATQDITFLPAHQGSVVIPQESVLPAHQGSVVIPQESVLPAHQGSVGIPQESVLSAHQGSVVRPQESVLPAHQGSEVIPKESVIPAHQGSEVIPQESVLSAHQGSEVIPQESVLPAHQGSEVLPQESVLPAHQGSEVIPQESVLPAHQGSEVLPQESVLPAHQGSVVASHEESVLPAHQGSEVIPQESVLPAHQGSVMATHEESDLPGHQGSLVVTLEESDLPGHQGSVMATHEESDLLGHQGSVMATHEESVLPAHQGSVVATHEESDLPGHQGSVKQLKDSSPSISVHVSRAEDPDIDMTGCKQQRLKASDKGQENQADKNVTHEEVCPEGNADLQDGSTTLVEYCLELEVSSDSDAENKKVRNAHEKRILEKTN